MKFKKILTSLLSIPILSELVSAHCLLCTVGAGAAAAGAVWLGINKVVVALFIGAFSMSMGIWFSKLSRKKKFFRYQGPVVLIGVFLLTFLPLIPIIKSYGLLTINLAGSYGSFLNKTYMLNYSLVSGLLGAFVTFFSPKLNKKFKQYRKGIPYQGILITFSLLIITSLIIQFILV